ncbi:hypothetical protein GKZ90_0000915 [Flavobacterium sp. MC2016-06]|jgi:hypothetical protein|uniref:hypothetical protein n=1 Tax=Flavobacterium sp. MC2016-06 TaxID=2676308 RepID=UPI0012BB1795|nr:hypothetical protein [Flavobacterium sp. MC2016-06]MBU3859128.1 hypothetical protein [Flavobacterium sp. MC2016-06]
MTTPQTITVPITDQQHLLFLFIPLKKGVLAEAMLAAEQVKEAAKLTAAAPVGDLRKTTGVHYFTIYTQADGQPTPGIPVPGFQSYPGKDVLVVMSIYDGQFDAYISAFFQIDAIVKGLDTLLLLMDETGIPNVDPQGKTSAYYINKMGGVKKNPLAFYCLLMRYNFGDPVLSAGDSDNKNREYTFGTNFPGLTVAKIIDNYPNADKIWPAVPGQVNYQFPTALKPDCK